MVSNMFSITDVKWYNTVFLCNTPEKKKERKRLGMKR